MALEYLPQTLVMTGVTGLDQILGGGLVAHRLYLIDGSPGAGKTTLALQFLMEGARLGESVLYITLSETAEELRANAASHGWAIENIPIFELLSGDGSMTDTPSTIFHPSEIELGETIRAILAEVERIQPVRIVFDSLSELRLLAQNSLRYRRQIMILKQFFNARKCTVLLLDDRTTEIADLQLQSIANGVISLEQLAPEYGAERRRLKVLKLRGRQYRGGWHDFRIIPGGLSVFPRLVTAEDRVITNDGLLASGVKELDMLLGGGLEYGTSTVLIGPAGTGKSSLALLYAIAAAARGEHSALFVFDESITTLQVRAAGIGLNLSEPVNQGLIHIRQIDPAELSPGEFAHIVRETVEYDETRVVVIDSLTGYINAMPEERLLLVQMHELLTYLGQQGVVTLLIVAQQGFLVPYSSTSSINISYLADTVVLTRYFEVFGQVNSAISVVKKRQGYHERTIRQLEISSSGISVSAPLRDFQGVLTGVPRYEGTIDSLLGSGETDA